MREAGTTSEDRDRDRDARMAANQGATPPAWLDRPRWRLFRDVVGGLRQNWDKLRQLVALIVA